MALVLTGAPMMLLRALGYREPLIDTVAVLAGLAAVLAYWTILHAHGRQTVGKMVIGAVVVQTNLRTIGYGRALGRFFAEALSAIPFNLGYLWAIWDPEKQTFHDKIASTLVIRKADVPARSQRT